MRRKLVPALFHLFEKEKLPDQFCIIGSGRRELDQKSFHRLVLEDLRTHQEISEEKARHFLNLFLYVRGDLKKRESYNSLKKELESIDRKWGICSNKLFYLAVTPELYQTIFQHLAGSGLTLDCGSSYAFESPKNLVRLERLRTAAGWTRVIVEKPFGKDFKTAKKLDSMLGTLFREDQIYRIDHYLAKEMLQNILTFRFSNNLLEKNWSKETIERIDIKLWEKIGVEDRGAFYDGIGALRDVGQNHLLQMLGLVTMDRPVTFIADEIRTRRAEILKTLRILTPAEIKEKTFRAQYEGYRKIKGVDPKSNTETYFKIVAELNAPRWEGVPVTLESGKRMGEARKEIVVTFRHPMPCLCEKAVSRVRDIGDSTAVTYHYQNKVVFSLEPQERITIHFWAKKPGLTLEMEERSFEFLFRESQAKRQYVEEYEKLMLDCIAGDQMLFLSTEEVKAMWKFIDPIIHAWHRGAVKLERYKPDTSAIARKSPQGFLYKRGEREDLKEIGLIGLGKMGMNLGIRLTGFGWKVVAFDPSPEARIAAEKHGIIVVDSIKKVVVNLKKPRVIWLMVPPFAKASGDTKTLTGRLGGKSVVKPVDEIIFGTEESRFEQQQSISRSSKNTSALSKLLKQGDIIIDGGNSFYEDSIRRAEKLKKLGIHFLDVGVSGGPKGARDGSSLMIGGEKEIFERIEHLFQDLSAPQGYGWVGKSGAGHFVKMVHNGIEYGIMQALAEGFNLLRYADKRGLRPSAGGIVTKRRNKIKYKFDLGKIARIYNHGSVIESRLMGWLEDVFHEFGEDLKGVSGAVSHTGEGKWTVEVTKRLKVPAQVIKAAFNFRVKSKRKPSYTGKILTALRNRFGEHPIK